MRTCVCVHAYLSLTCGVGACAMYFGNGWHKPGSNGSTAATCFRTIFDRCACRQAGERASERAQSVKAVGVLELRALSLAPVAR